MPSKKVEWSKWSASQCVTVSRSMTGISFLSARQGVRSRRSAFSGPHLCMRPPLIGGTVMGDVNRPKGFGLRAEGTDSGCCGIRLVDRQRDEMTASLNSHV